LPIRTDGARARVDSSGKPAHTEWKVLQQRDGVSLLQLELHTGRMHQVRVHLQAIGHPVVGDRWYGGAAASRLMLHAARLVFPDPGSQRVVTLDAPWPQEWLQGWTACP
jgi:23S rRNA-/tRNA-specific pseudouridylate synthase